MHHRGRKFNYCPFSPSFDSLITWAHSFHKYSSLGTIFTHTHGRITVCCIWTYTWTSFSRGVWSWALYNELPMGWMTKVIIIQLPGRQNFSPKYADWPWYSDTVLLNGCWGHLPSGKVAEAWSWPLTPCSANVKNEWSYISPSPHMPSQHPQV
jgi:hypothetical protein